MKPRLNLLMGCLLLLGTMAVQAKTVNSSQPTALFFVMHASAGTLQAQHDPGNHYILKLDNILPDITYFSDYPEHRVGSVPLNTLAIVASRRVSESFSGALSFRLDNQKSPSLTTTIVQVNHYVFLVRKDQIVAQVQIKNPHLQADHYAIQNVLLEFDGMWFLPYLHGVDS